MWLCELASSVTAGLGQRRVQLLWAISDHKTNGETREVLNIYSLNEVTVDLTNGRTQSLSEKNDKHNSKLAYAYMSAGRRNLARSREIWRERKPCGCNEHRMAQILLLLTKALIFNLPTFCVIIFPNKTSYLPENVQYVAVRKRASVCSLRGRN